MFKAVKQSKAPQQIIHQIRSSILEGTLKSNDKLASEIELMEKFGVSKSTLREALRALEYLGLIEIRKGVNGGAFVVEVDMEITKEHLTNFLHFKNISVNHLSEIRKILEPYAAHIAAEKMSEEDLGRLEDHIESCTKALLVGDSEALRKYEIMFHRTIAHASQNPILILIIDFIENILDDVKKILKPGVDFSEKVIKSHKRIYKALSEKNSEMASREMLKDVSSVEKELAKLKFDKNINILLNHK